MKKMFLFFSHKLAQKQTEDAKRSLGAEEFVYLPEDLQQIFSNVPPELESLKEYARPLMEFLEREAKNGDIALIQGDFGLTWILVNLAFRQGVMPVYATTKRVAIEKMVDGKSVKISQFEQFDLGGMMKFRKSTLKEGYILVLIFLIVMIAGIIAKWYFPKVWDWFGAIDTASAVALAFLALLGYVEYIRSEDEIELVFDVEGNLEPTGYTILRKNFTRSEVMGVLGKIFQSIKKTVIESNIPKRGIF